MSRGTAEVRNFFSGPLGGEAMTRVPLCPELDKQGRKWANLRLIARRKRNQKLARETALTQAKREQNARYSKTGPRYWKAHFAAVWPRRVFCLLITSCFFFFFSFLSWILFRHSNYSFAGPAPILSESKGNEGKNQADRSVGRTKWLFPKVSANGVTKKARTDPAQVVSLFLLLKSLIATFIFLSLFFFRNTTKGGSH